MRDFWTRLLPPQETVEKEHQAIYKAVADNDLTAARKTMRRHLRNVYANAMKGIQNRLMEEKKIII